MYTDSVQCMLCRVCGRDVHHTRQEEARVRLWEEEEEEEEEERGEKVRHTLEAPFERA